MTRLFSGMVYLNVGTPLFKNELEKQGVKCAQVDWKPPAGGDAQLAMMLDTLVDSQEIDRANEETVSRIKQGQPILIGMGLAGDVIPGMTRTTILHAGPPITYDRMCGPMKGAVQGALVYEGVAEDVAAADALAASGEIVFKPCNEMSCVGPMAGIVSATMPVYIVENKTYGNRAYATVNEGLGKVLRFGANDEEVLARLRYIRDGFFPIMRQAIETAGGVDLRNLIAQGLSMGDECHNRNKATTAIFLRDLLPYFLNLDEPFDEVRRAIEFIGNNEHCFLNISMASCKAILEAAEGVEHSTIVTTMSRNGVEFGIRVSGLPQDQWFTGPAEMVDGLLFPGFSDNDCAPDLGDSCITETCGIGGFAMAAAPAIVQFVGGNVSDAVAYSRSMYEITESESKSYFIPTLNFRGTATGIDVRKVLSTNILPVINTGIAHRDAGVGQVGAGIVHPPAECFEKATRAICSAWGMEASIY